MSLLDHVDIDYTALALNLAVVVVPAALVLVALILVIRRAARR
jgi:hypothetical protein